MICTLFKYSSAQVLHLCNEICKLPALHSAETAKVQVGYVSLSSALHVPCLTLSMIGAGVLDAVQAHFGRPPQPVLDAWDPLAALDDPNIDLNALLHGPRPATAAAMLAPPPQLAAAVRLPPCAPVCLVELGSSCLCGLAHHACSQQLCGAGLVLGSCWPCLRF